MASNFIKLPSYMIQYWEFDQKIEYPVEMSQSPLRIDGLFCPYSSRRFSLGSLGNFRRRSETLDCLVKIGEGLMFAINDQDCYEVENFSEYPVYIWIKKNRSEPLKLESGKSINLFELKPLWEHKVLPKRVGKLYDDFSMKISFCEPFQKQSEQLTSPCWVEMSLNKMVEAPI